MLVPYSYWTMTIDTFSREMDCTLSTESNDVIASSSFLVTRSVTSSGLAPGYTVAMINIGIYNGDYIIVREQKSAMNGEIVVAMIDGSATVKTFYKEQGRVRLQPENDTMEPIYATNPVILGKVVGLMRRFS